MRVLAFRHVPFEHLGRIAPALEEHGIAWEYVDLYRDGESCAAEEDADGLIFMGGPMSVNDDLAYLREEERIIRAAVERAKPVLGVCLGAQLIAHALGARVYRNAVKEIGWAPVHWTDAAGQDALLAGLNQPETVFHWHGETFDLPMEAEWLAWSDGCRHQAFRAGHNAYGLQFHPEVTPEMIACWCKEDANSGDVRELEAPIDVQAHSQRLGELSRMIFGRWAKLVLGATEARSRRSPPAADPSHSWRS